MFTIWFLSLSNCYFPGTSEHHFKYMWLCVYKNKFNLMKVYTCCCKSLGAHFFLDTLYITCQPFHFHYRQNFPAFRLLFCILIISEWIYSAFVWSVCYHFYHWFLYSAEISKLECIKISRPTRGTHYGWSGGHFLPISVPSIPSLCRSWQLWYRPQIFLLSGCCHICCCWLVCVCVCWCVLAQ